MSLPERIPLGMLAGQPVEYVQSYFHPDSTTQSGMVCGMPTRWLRWGGGSWCVMSDRAKLFMLQREWLTVEWSGEDAAEIWARHVEDLSGWTPEQHGAGPFNAEAHERWKAAHQLGARDYARRIGVLT